MDGFLDNKSLSMALRMAREGASAASTALQTMLLRQLPLLQQGKTPSSPHLFKPTSMKLGTTGSASPCGETRAQRRSAGSSRDAGLLLSASEPGSATSEELEDHPL